MKKIIMIVTVTLLLAAFAIYALQKSNKTEESQVNKSVGTSESNSHSDQKKTTSKEKNVNENKDENIMHKVPMIQFKGMTNEEIKQKLQEDGAENIEIRNDSVIFTMPQNVYQQNIKKMDKQIDEMLQQINAKDNYPSIQSITTDNNYSTFTVTVDQAAYKDSFDSIAVFSLMAAVTYFYNYQGNDEFKIKVEYIDAATNEKFAEESYPQEE